VLYIHIPFCDSKCHYCAFNSFTTNHHLKGAYVDALLAQLRFEIEHFEVKNFRTVFIGGGTPSTLPVSMYERIFSLLEPYLENCQEITIEANPTAKKEWIFSIKEFATRISFGVQSFNEDKLKFLGRSHSPKDAIEAIENAAKAGFSHINLDLIYDCSIDSYKLLQNDIDLALSLPIDHISAYALTLEENTPFFGQPVKKNEERFAYYVKGLIERRLPQYEVSNFGTPSLHNLGYWELRDYVGAGCGAVGFKKNRRFYPSSDLHTYIANPLAIDEECLSEEDLRMERIFLGLRSCVGVDKELVDEAKANILCEEGKLRFENGRYYNTNYFLADEIALFLL